VDKLALLATVKVKAGKEKAVEAFLKSALPMAEAEPGTVRFYAVKMGPDRFGIFNTFRDEDGRDAHLNGDIAAAIFDKAREMLAEPPQIEMLEILTMKEATFRRKAA
jgi:quinol monooxygenase YgiN